MRDYSAAIKCLNSLQTNAAILEAIRSTGNLINQLSMPEMKRYLERIGYNYKDLNKLNVIHVAGTKGKGSTSSFCNSILNQYSFKEGDRLIPIRTGLYSSPHILEVRERIRINGSPISKESFAKYFFNVWDRLEETVPPVIDIHNPDKPSYFRYLTLVAFHAFLQEKVDTVILEVGVGGEYDATNVVESPVVCGITPLGMDHVASLGDTIEKIAWHKAGIIKENSPVFTVNQPGDAIKIIQARATERKATKCQIITPEQLEKISSIKLGLSGEHQKINAALAVALCEEWIKIQSSKGLQIVGEPDAIKKGLESAFWPGRCQRLVINRFPRCEWFLDGAHTPESLLVCGAWFNTVSKLKSNAKNVLIFNCTHGRMGASLFPSLIKSFVNNVEFDKVIFTTNDPWKNPAEHENGDLVNNMIIPDTTYKNQHQLADVWKSLCKESSMNTGEIFVVGSTEEAIEVASSNSTSSDTQILITGSLHLVGSCLAVLDPNVH